MHPYDCGSDCVICKFWRMEAERYAPVIAAAFDRQFNTERKDEMSFTADEYRTAAKVLEYEADRADPEMVAHLKGLAEKLEKRRDYAINLGLVAPANSPESRGHILLAKLLQDGWTPPKGLC